MPEIKSDLIQETNQLYRDVQENLTHDNGYCIIISHFGIFSQDLVNTLSEGIENDMKERGAKKSLIKRMFSILIEGLQNLRIHGAKDVAKKQLGHVVIANNENDYKISFGNIALKDDVPKLTAKLDYLNSLPQDEVKSYYMEVLSNGEISEKGGAGLGFITIALKSKSKLNYSFKPLDENSFYFTLNINLSV